MVMIDRLTYAGERSAAGSFFIEDSNIFCADGYLPEAGMVEFIAQTAAAYTGYLQIEAGKGISLGYIGAVKNLVINSLPEAGTEIKSEIIVESEVLGYTIITGRVIQYDRILAECEMRIKLDNP
jgi:predicted hotdog family 3-hydroxylacyl-ACP dehydratase